MEKSCRECLALLRELLSGPAQSIGGYGVSTGHSTEASDREEEYAIGQQRKGHLCYRVERILLDCAYVLVFCNTDLVSNEMRKIPK